MAAALFELLAICDGSTIGISTNLTWAGFSLTLTATANPMVGAGLFGGVGLTSGVRVSDCPPITGNSQSPYAEMGVGSGPSAGIGLAAMIKARSPVLVLARLG